MQMISTLTVEFELAKSELQELLEGRKGKQ